MNHKLQSEEMDSLYEAISFIKSKEEFYNFFEDLCTVVEMQSLAHRFSVAKMLYDGKTYCEVGELTGASTATISRISKCLTYGADGYKTILQRMKDRK